MNKKEFIKKYVGLISSRWDKESTESAMAQDLDKLLESLENKITREQIQKVVKKVVEDRVNREKNEQDQTKI
jgi:hypothetical protein